MSRSRRKTPIIGNCSWRTSEKQDKRLYNRRYRRACTLALVKDYLAGTLPHLKEHSNPWAMSKDGKKWCDLDFKSRWLRK